MRSSNYIKQFAIIYGSLVVALIPYAIYKLFEMQDYPGSLNETLEGALLILCFQIIEALILVGITKFVEVSFKQVISMKYLFLIPLVLQLFLLYLVI